MKDNKLYRSTVTEDHYSLLMEPGSQFLGHMTPPEETPSVLAKYYIIIC